MQKQQDNTLKFNPVLHGFRAIAALAVVLFHWGSSIGFFPELRQQLSVTVFNTAWDLGMVLDFGWLGVPVFFVLSGYLLTTQLLHRGLGVERVKRFWLRRALRIYPAYWLQLLVLLILASRFSFMPQLTTSGDIARHVLLWINLPPWMTLPMNSVWWTLPVELGFYLLLPLLVTGSNRFGWLRVFAAVIAITLCWRYAVMWHYRGENYAAHQAVLDAIPGALSTFCSGVALAYFVTARGVAGESLRYLLLAVSLVLFYLMMCWLRSNLDSYWSSHWMLGVWNPIMGLLISVIMYTLIVPLNGFQWLSSGLLVWLGNISFGIYLWHYPLLMLLDRTILSDWKSPWLNVLALAVTLAGTLVLASISYYFVEKPLLDKKW